MKIIKRYSEIKEIKENAKKEKIKIFLEAYTNKQGMPKNIVFFLNNIITNIRNNNFIIQYTSKDNFDKRLADYVLSNEFFYLLKGDRIPYSHELKNFLNNKQNIIYEYKYSIVSLDNLNYFILLAENKHINKINDLLKREEQLKSIATLYGQWKDIQRHLVNLDNLYLNKTITYNYIKDNMTTKDEICCYHNEKNFIPIELCNVAENAILIEL